MEKETETVEVEFSDEALAYVTRVADLSQRTLEDVIVIMLAMHIVRIEHEHGG